MGRTKYGKVASEIFIMYIKMELIEGFNYSVKKSPLFNLMNLFEYNISEKKQFEFIPLVLIIKVILEQSYKSEDLIQ